jgi:predicted nucleic acid-binding protein
MKVLFDTSVLVAALVEAHPAHPKAFRWLVKARKQETEFFVSAHSLLEIFAVLTRMPIQPRITPGLAQRLLRANVESQASIITLTKKDYLEVIGCMAELGLSGAVVYDALIARCAQKKACDHLLTLNEKDFIRVWPLHNGVIRSP